MATYNDLPLFQFVLDPNEPSDGIKAVALVDEPAIDSKAKFFDSKLKHKFVSIDGDEYEGKVAGLLLRHSYPILRMDENQNYYYGEFSQETVKELQEKFHKELQSNNVNTDHEDDQKVDAYMVEDFIIHSEELLKHVQSMGIEEAQLGDWYGVYQIDDEETFKRIVDGELTGFSIEAWLDVEMRKVLKNNEDFKKLFKMDNKESKNLLLRFFDFLKNQIETFESESTEEELEEKKFEEELVPDEGFVLVWGEIGEKVSKKYTNDAGEEVIEDAGEGRYVVESGMEIVVDAESNLVEIVEPAPAEEEASAESTEEEMAEEAPAEETPEEMAAEEAPAETEEELAEEDTSVKGDLKALLDSLLGEHDDGEFYVSVYKEDGEYRWGSVSMYKDLKFAKEVEENEQKLTDRIAELEKQLGVEPASDPKLGNEETEDAPKEFKDMTAYERLAAKNGWEKYPTIKMVQ